MNNITEEQNRLFFNNMSNTNVEGKIICFPKKLVMIEQQSPYHKVTFTKRNDGYELMVENLVEPIYLTKKEFVKSVVDHKEKHNFKVVEIVNQ